MKKTITSIVIALGMAAPAVAEKLNIHDFVRNLSHSHTTGIQRSMWGEGTIGKKASVYGIVMDVRPADTTAGARVVLTFRPSASDPSVFIDCELADGVGLEIISVLRKGEEVRCFGTITKYDDMLGDRFTILTEIQPRLN